MINSPFEILATPVADWLPDTDPVGDAVKQFDPANPAPLIELLQSNDALISRRGLWVFDELGQRGKVALDAALELHNHPDQMARNHLLDGVICYPSALNAIQACVVLSMMSDPFALVREKVVIFLAHADPNAVKGAIALMQEPHRSEHLEGLSARCEPSQAQQLFDEACRRGGIWGGHAFAAIARTSRTGILERAPEYTGQDYVAHGVVHHIKMHIARRTRLRAPARRSAT